MGRLPKQWSQRSPARVVRWGRRQVRRERAPKSWHDLCNLPVRVLRKRVRTEATMQCTTAKYSGALIFAAVLAVNPLTASAVKAADIKIGAPLGLTGAVSDEAKKQEVTFKMWLAKVNAAGGINVGGTKMKVQLVQYDYQSDGQRAAQLAGKLITDDKGDVLFSPFGSGHTQIVATIPARFELPILACAP